MTDYRTYLLALIASPAALALWQRPADVQIIPIDYGQIPGAVTSRKLEIPEGAEGMVQEAVTEELSLSA